MRYEYFLFNVVVVFFPLVLSFWRPSFFLHHWGRAWLSIAVVACPFVLWDAWVAGTHWTFNSNYVLGFKVAGLPVEEIMFFFTVPFSCLYSWQMFFRPETIGHLPKAESTNTSEPEHHPSQGLAWLSWLWLVCLPFGIWFLWQGQQYTGLTLLALVTAWGLDRVLNIRLFQYGRFYLYLLLVVMFTLLFNGYLTYRPVVLYGEAYQVGIRIGTIPIEDFGYGLSLVACVTILFEWRKKQDRQYGSWLERLICWRFGGYRHQVNVVDSSLPVALSSPKRVAVIGGGLAGMTAAAYLGERGFQVTLLEKNGYLGGKAGAWSITHNDGSQAQIEHGFHAFFRHYYNLNTLLEKVGVTRHFRSIEDYTILTQNREVFRFKDVATTPLINLLSLSHHGIYRLSEVALSKTGPQMEVFLRYDAEKTFGAFDHISFAEFATQAKLPRNLMLIFNTFARAFFADSHRISMAELIKSFHFYYLSHNHGLIYDYLDEDYDTALLQPFRDFYQKHGVQTQCDIAVANIEKTPQGFMVEGEAYDYLILATDVVGTRHVVASSPDLRAFSPGWTEQILSLRPSQRYAVLRIWLDRDIHLQHPVFVITERYQILDAIALYHRAEQSSARWVETHGGGIFELHCYAVPDHIESNEQIRALFLEEFERYCPEIQGYHIVHEHLQVHQNFTAFHLNMYAQRPTTETPIPGLFLAGDWVKLPYPAMLMEAACMSGLLATQHILQQEGLQTIPLYSVPPTGFLVVES